MATLSLKEYLHIVTDKMEQAEKENNKEEWTRLARLVIKLLQEKIGEINA